MTRSARMRNLLAAIGLDGRAAAKAVVAVALSLHCPAQFAWQPDGAPFLNFPSTCYDATRDRLVRIGRGAFSGVDLTEEFDPARGWYLAAPTAPPNPDNCSIAFDPITRRVVASEAGTTWSWNGATWTQVGAQSGMVVRFLMEHRSRGRMVGIGVTSTAPGPALFDWNGSSWNAVPSPNQLPYTMVPGRYFTVYLSATYDARRDRVVLLGSATFDVQNSLYTNVRPDVWEWTPATGWVSRPVTFPTTFWHGVKLVFDGTRGTVLALMRVYPKGLRIFEWDGGNAWVEHVPWILLPPNLGATDVQYGHDSRRGRTYVNMIDGNNVPTPAFLMTYDPAVVLPHGAGCPGSLGQSELRPSETWTLAWLGRQLSVDLTNLPQAAGFLAMGWSATAAGPYTLPFALDAFGMQGCTLHVAPDVIYPLAGSTAKATFTMPVPSDAALIGCQFFQQGFAIDPAANAAGLTASNGALVLIGRQ